MGFPIGTISGDPEVVELLGRLDSGNGEIKTEEVANVDEQESATLVCNAETQNWSESQFLKVEASLVNKGLINKMNGYCGATPATYGTYVKFIREGYTPALDALIRLAAEDEAAAAALGNLVRTENGAVIMDKIADAVSNYGYNGYRTVYGLLSLLEDLAAEGNFRAVDVLGLAAKRHYEAVGSLDRIAKLETPVRRPAHLHMGKSGAPFPGRSAHARSTNTCG